MYPVDPGLFVPRTGETRAPVTILVEEALR